jgi:hypothetical protein
LNSPSPGKIGQSSVLLQVGNRLITCSDKEFWWNALSRYTRPGRQPPAASSIKGVEFFAGNTPLHFLVLKQVVVQNEEEEDQARMMGMFSRVSHAAPDYAPDSVK